MPGELQAVQFAVSREQVREMADGTRADRLVRMRAADDQSIAGTSVDSQHA